MDQDVYRYMYRSAIHNQEWHKILQNTTYTITSVPENTRHLIKQVDTNLVSESVHADKHQKCTDIQKNKSLKVYRQTNRNHITDIQIDTKTNIKEKIVEYDLRSTDCMHILSSV